MFKVYVYAQTVGNESPFVTWWMQLHPRVQFVIVALVLIAIYSIYTTLKR